MKCYNSSEESKFIMNWGANNLNGLARSEHFPYGDSNG